MILYYYITQKQLDSLRVYNSELIDAIMLEQYIGETTKEELSKNKAIVIIDEQEIDILEAANKVTVSVNEFKGG